MTERFEMRLAPSVLEEVDGWRTRQSDFPSRAEAVRRLIEAGLRVGNEEKKRVTLSDGDRLVLLLFQDLFKHLKIRSEIEPEFIAEVIHGGHTWGLEWRYTGVFHGHEDSGAVVREVVDILSMWSLLESGYENLSENDQQRVAAEADLVGGRVRFDGFDGNEESEHLGVARFLLDQLNRFEQFKGRELNAHIPTVGSHRRMLSVFEPMRGTLMGRDLNAEEIIQILRAQPHPRSVKGLRSRSAGS